MKKTIKKATLAALLLALILCACGDGKGKSSEKEAAQEAAVVPSVAACDTVFYGVWEFKEATIIQDNGTEKLSKLYGEWSYSPPSATILKDNTAYFYTYESPSIGIAVKAGDYNCKLMFTGRYAEGDYEPGNRQVAFRYNPDTKLLATNMSEDNQWKPGDVIYYLEKDLKTDVEEETARIKALAAEIATAQAAARDSSEKFVPAGYTLLEKVQGDLNKDGAEDDVLVIQRHHKDDEDPMMGIIVAFRKGAGYEQVLVNKDGLRRRSHDLSFPSIYISIERGNLFIRLSSSKDSDTYNFRYQNSNFELIGYDFNGTEWDRSGYHRFESRIVSINFLSKKRHIRERSDRNVRFTETWENFTMDEPIRLRDITDFGTFNLYENIRVISLTDSRDNKTYRTVKIGSQNWMAENLNYQTQGSSCYDNNNSNCAIYGRLYNWDAAMKACPAGWWLPDTTAWNDLARAVGGSFVGGDPFGYWQKAGMKLKSKFGWNNNGNGIDEYGFSAQPGGSPDCDECEDFDGVGGVGGSGSWWSATNHGGSSAYTRIMVYNNDHVDVGSWPKDGTLSVRCVQK